VIWTAFIFSNSLQTASESLEQSGFFVDMFSNLVKWIYNDSVPSWMVIYMETGLVDDIRSLAHIFEFFVLYIFAWLSIGYFKQGNFKTKLAFLYGISVIVIDETIQIFVDGRGFQFKDMILDACGLFIAYIVVAAATYFIYKKRLKKGEV